MAKSLLAGLAALVLGLSSCASLPVQYREETGKSTNGHSEEIEYARWCADKGYWEEAVRYLKIAEFEAVSEKEKSHLRQELAENYLLMVEWDYFVAGKAEEELAAAKFYCQEARENLSSVPAEYRKENYGLLLESLDFTCDRIESSLSPSLR